jgi:glucokinase
VAQHVLAQPRGVLNAPVAGIARAAQVSQPTVIRFCRSLGCEGLPDFKLRLAASLTGAVPVAHSRVSGDDSSTELGAKVLGNTASAILRVRDQLNRDSIDRAIGLLNAAGRIDFHASALNGPVAQDAQFKFMRLGLPSHAYTDARLQALAASTLAAGDVVVLIGSTGTAGGASGRTGELVAVADMARERGARIIAITAGQSALAKKADVALAVDPEEDPEQQLPMISRVLQLLVIDILAVGVSMRREGAGLTAHAHR